VLVVVFVFFCVVWEKFKAEVRLLMRLRPLDVILVEVSLGSSGVDLSPDSFFYGKGSRFPPLPLFPRFTNGRPIAGVSFCRPVSRRFF